LELTAKSLPPSELWELNFFSLRLSQPSTSFIGFHRTTRSYLHDDRKWGLKSFWEPVTNREITHFKHALWEAD